MAHFAHVNNGIVDSVIVIEQAVIDDAGGWYCPECRMHVPAEEWVQTSYNTQEGVHKQGGTPLRKNYAGKGYSYHTDIDAFVPPKESEDFILDTQKGIWKAPKEMPKDGKLYKWNPAKHDWSLDERVVTKKII